MYKYSQKTKMDFRWFIENSWLISCMYSDEWIAISNQRIVAHNDEFQEVLRIVQEENIEYPFITYINPEVWQLPN